MMKEQRDITFKGNIVESGVRIGEIRIVSEKKKTKPEASPVDILKELFRFKRAKESAATKLLELYEKVFADIGEEGASIIMAYQAILEDPEFLDEIKLKINEGGMTAEQAVTATAERLENHFGDLDDEYMKARRNDIKDVADRLLECLAEDDERNGEGGSTAPQKTEGKEDGPKSFLTSYDGKAVKSKGFVLLATELTPTDTVKFDRNELAGIVTYKGSENSHTSIIARSMKIPALILEKTTSDEDFAYVLDLDLDGQIAIVDGDEGIVILNPSAEILEQYEAKKNGASQKSADKEKTGQGYFANVNSIEDIRLAMEMGFDGVGLFRTEFLYMSKDKFPTVEEQFAVYKEAAEITGEKPLIVRTFDLGSDKKVSYLKYDSEKNPALGLRGLRFSLKYKEELKKQLKALYMASAFGNIKVMYPMVSSVDELLMAKAVAKEAKDELVADGIEVTDIEQGITVETPAAVFSIEELLNESDFISVGTNDLTQYMYACDRENPTVTEFVDKTYSAVLKAVQHVAEAAHAVGKKVSLCGELGGDKAHVNILIELGVDEISVSVSRV